MGHLLYLFGEVSEKTMKKYERDSSNIGKSSFAYAWVLDETGEERSRYDDILLLFLCIQSVYSITYKITGALQWILQLQNLKLNIGGLHYWMLQDIGILFQI